MYSNNLVIMYIYCQIRQKFVKKTPEEIIRQYIIKYLLDKGFDKSLFRIEKQIFNIKDFKYRPDIVVYDNKCEPYIIIECKAKNVNIKENCVEQIANYNRFLNSKYLIITNGNKIYCWEKDNDKYKCISLKDIILY